MSGKRLLDLAALLNASRGVAQKHVVLRSRQADVYTRTSTLARAVKTQTDRVTETLRAASLLTSRLSESPPEWMSEATDGPAGEEQIPSRKSTQGPETPNRNINDGLQQDHFYERSMDNSAVGSASSDGLVVKQEKADCYPFPDGTLPAPQSTLSTPARDNDTFGTIPKNELPKQPLKERGRKPGSPSIPTIPIPARKHLSAQEAMVAQRKSELQIPSRSADAFDSSVTGLLEDGHDEDSFHRKSTHTSASLSSLPRVKLPKHTSDTQEGDTHLPEQINSDSFYGTTATSLGPLPSVQAVPVQEQVPDGINTDLFYSPRVARALGGNTQGSAKSDLKLRGVKDTPLDQTDLAMGKDQDTFKVLRSSQKHPLDPTGRSAPQQETQQKLNMSNAAVEDLADDFAKEALAKKDEVHPQSGPQHVPYALVESKVPSSRLGRLWNYSTLAAGMFGGVMSESIRRVSGSGGDGSYILNAGNMDRLVSKLSRMRGAALKLGQMISFQDSKMLPGPIQEVLQRVQDRADYMPASQRNKVMTANLGPNWRDLYSAFDEIPLAAASIGQVHSAVLKSSGTKVAVKVQYPGVADSIDSDLSNLAVLLTASRLLPKGLFLDKTIANARTELGWECDYVREAECARRFGTLLADETDIFVVPKVFPEASGHHVLTMEFVEGVGVTRVASFTQEQKDWIGTQILRLCLREITEFRFMQTDPNWTNFLYNAQTNKLELLDFGASREYPKAFIDKYTRLLAAASKSDKKTLEALSIELGYLTGQESKAMLDAHIASILTLAEPFLGSSPEVYDFKDQTITERVKEQIPLMIRERLAPPPEETYSLHRKLSGAFLLCARLGSRVRCRELFENSMKKAGIF